MELLLSFSIGIGLSAACGYRVFVPLLGMSIAAAQGHISLPEGMQWISTQEALIAFAVATAAEIAAYYIPFVDNMLDTIAAPAAIAAGTIVMASFVTDMSPLLKWGLAIIAGGGTAGLFQGSTTLIRGTSTVVTAGMGNFAVTSVETGIAIFLTLLALLLPLTAGIVVIALVTVALKNIIRKRMKRS